MKETVKRLLCLVLALSAVFVLASCKEEEKTTEPEETTQQTETQEETTEPVEEPSLVGKWRAQVDLADYISDMTYDVYGADLIFNPCILEIIITFEDDGTYKVKLKDKLDDALEELDEAFINTSMKILAKKYEMTDAKFEREVKAAGYTREEYVKLFADAIMTYIYEEIEYCEENLKGKWLLEDDELYLAETKPEKADPFIITLENDTFTVTEITDDELEVSDYFLPLVFERD